MDRKLNFSLNLAREVHNNGDPKCPAQLAYDEIQSASSLTEVEVTCKLRGFKLRKGRHSVQFLCEERSGLNGLSRMSYCGAISASNPLPKG